jgi:hypothetical protein
MSDLPIVCDLDDLISEDQIIEYLVPIKEAVPQFRVTCYAVPTYLGDVHELKDKYPWITFAQHGFTHTHFECGAWSDTAAKYFLERGRDLGYEPLFKAPNWINDIDIEVACHEKAVILHHHEKNEPSKQGLLAYHGPRGKRKGHHASLHTHILRNPSTDFIGEHPGFSIENLRTFNIFETPVAFAVMV